MRSCNLFRDQPNPCYYCLKKGVEVIPTTRGIKKGSRNRPYYKDVQDMVLVVENNKEVVKDTFGIKHEVE